MEENARLRKERMRNFQAKQKEALNLAILAEVASGNIPQQSPETIPGTGYSDPMAYAIELGI